jgi:hypothetical protein
MEESERRELQRFIDEFEELIDDILRHPDWFPVELREPLARAWRDVSPKLRALRTAIDDSRYQNALDAEGFTDSELALKMAVWDAALRRARQGRLRTPRRRWWESLFDWLRPLQGVLKVANAILESIGEAIPGVGAVEEFKKMLEGALDLGDSGAPLKKLASWVRRRFHR